MKHVMSDITGLRFRIHVRELTNEIWARNGVLISFISSELAIITIDYQVRNQAWDTVYGER